MPAVRRDPVDELADLVMAMNPDQLEAWSLSLDPADLELVESIVAGTRHYRWTPLPHQVMPDLSKPWRLWLMMGGRGTGKTDAGAHAMDEHARGPACLPGLPGGHRMSIIAPTRGDASDSCVNSPAGLRAHNPQVKEITRKGGTIVTWPNGAEAKLFGAYTKEDVERLRAGGNRCFVWCEELAAWRYLRACWNHMTLGLRLGQHPRVIASTTPKNRKHLRKLLADARTMVTTATTYDNPHLSADVRAEFERVYSGTRLGRQELLAELLDDVEGALWTLGQIEADRLDPEDHERTTYRRVVVGVDPSWGTTNDECGIVVAGSTWTDEAHVLADYSVRGGPAVWGEAVAEAFWTWQADIVAAEGNFQGEQVRLVMQQVEHPLGAPPTKLVHASRGKQLRAEPVVMLYEQHRVHHLGVLAGLEDQMTTWVPGAPNDDEDADDEMQAAVAQGNTEHEGDQDDNSAPSEFSPDRVDALVFTLTDLLLGESGTPLVVRREARRLTPPSIERSVISRPRRVGRR